MVRIASVSALALITAAGAQAQEPIESEQESFSVTQLGSGLDNPWALAFVPSGEMLVTERPGSLRVIEADGSLRATEVTGLPDDILYSRQGGLLEVALSPDFGETRHIYFTYAEGTEDANRTVLARGVLSDDLSALSDVEDLWGVNFEKAGGFHYGGRILFNDDGTLFVTLGDGGRYTEESQNNENHIGTIVRLNMDGSAADGNPEFENGAPGIYSYGHRNAQGIDRNPETGSVLSIEHGPRGGDELNIIEPGSNYGWPVISYGINYSGTLLTDQREAEGMAQPNFYWVPSIAPASLRFYTGEMFPAWQGDLFVPALAGLTLQRLEMDGDRVISVEDLLNDRDERYRDVRVGPDGALYVVVDGPDSYVLRLNHELTQREEEFDG